MDWWFQKIFFSGPHCPQVVAFKTVKCCDILYETPGGDKSLVSSWDQLFMVLAERAIHGE